MKLINLISLSLFGLTININLIAQTSILDGPKPGDIYKEYVLNLKEGRNWRVTDPNTERERARKFLPNPVMEILIDDLDGAIRAEALMDVWGGHTGTIGKQFRFNEKNWIDIPDHPTIKEDPECYNSEFNYITEIPLSHLVEGKNTFQGNSGGQTCFNFRWGQWGWYVMIVRIYYGNEKIHPTGKITYPFSGAQIGEFTKLTVDAQCETGINKIDVLAKYKGYDENGDGVFYDWHRYYHTPEIKNHVGTIYIKPYKIVWDNAMIPDQEPGAVSLIARIQNNDGVWYVTEIVDKLTFKHPEGISVKMYTATNIPKKFWVRAGRNFSCDVEIDNLENATEAFVHHRTWNGLDGGAGSGSVEHPLSVNSWSGKVLGVNHNFAYSVVDLPLSALKKGINKVAYLSDTDHHGIEILWPGPAIIIRYNSNCEKSNNSQ